MVLSAISAVTVAPAVAASLPPWWCFVILALPHLWYMWVLLHPSSTKRTASLFKMDAVEWFSGIAVALNVAQFAAVFTFVFTCGRFTVAQLMAAWSAQPWRVVALPLAALGLVFKVSIFNAIGKKGVYYGAKFGHSIPWVHGFPFSVTAHPQYLGSSLCIISVALALHDSANPGHDVLPAYWVALYLLTGIAEEGLCHSVEPFAPLASGQSPFVDNTSRKVVTAEAVRLALMAPIVIIRWAACAALALVYIAACRVTQALHVRTHAAHALLTRIAANMALMLLGFNLQVDSSGNSKARDDDSPVVANCLSYVDALVLNACMGPLRVVEPLPARGVPLLAPVMALAGVKPTRGLSFPEGTRTQGGCVLPFQPSAVPSSGAAIQPVGLRYSAANSFNASWTVTGRRATVVHAFQLTAAWMKDVQVFILPAVKVASASQRAEKAQAMLSTALGWPIVSADAGVKSMAPANGNGLASPRAFKPRMSAAGRPVSPLRSVSPPPTARRRAKAA